MKYFQRSNITQQSLRFKQKIQHPNSQYQNTNKQQLQLPNYSSKIQQIYRRLMTLIHTELIEKFYIQNILRYTQKLLPTQRIRYLEQQYALITSCQSNYHKIVTIIQSRKNCVQRIQQSLQLEVMNLNHHKALQTYCNSLSHLRFITLVLIQRIQDWRRQLVLLQLRIPKYFRINIKKFPLIFEYHGQNIMKSIQYDTLFLRNSILKKYIYFSKSKDPLLLYPFRVINTTGKHNRMKNFQSVCRLFSLNQDMQTRLQIAQKNLDQENQLIQNTYQYKYSTQNKALNYNKSNEFPLLFTKYENQLYSHSNAFDNNTINLIKPQSIKSKGNQRYKSQDRQNLKYSTSNMKNYFRSNDKEFQPKKLLNQIRKKKVEFTKKNKSNISDSSQNSLIEQKNITNDQQQQFGQTIQKDYIIKQKKQIRYMKLNKLQQSPFYREKNNQSYQNQYLTNRLADKMKTQTNMYQIQQKKRNLNKKYKRNVVRLKNQNEFTIKPFNNAANQNDVQVEQQSYEPIYQLNDLNKQYYQQEYQLQSVPIIYKFDYKKQQQKLKTQIDKSYVSKYKAQFQKIQTSLPPITNNQNLQTKNHITQSIKLVEKDNVNQNQNKIPIKLEESLQQQIQKPQKSKAKLSINSVDIPFNKFHQFATFYGGIFSKEELISIQKLILMKKFHHFYFSEVRQDGQPGAIAVGSIAIQDKIRYYQIYLFKYLQKTNTKVQKLLKCYLDYIWSFDPANKIVYIRNKYYINNTIQQIFKKQGFKISNINFNNQDLQNTVLSQQRIKKCRNLLMEKSTLTCQLTNILMKKNDKKILYSLEIEAFSQQNYYSEYLLYHLIKFAAQRSNMQIKQQYMTISKFMKQHFQARINHKCYNFDNIQQLNQHLTSKQLQIYQTKQKIQNLQLVQLLIYQNFSFDYIVNKKSMIFQTDNKWTFFNQDQQSQYVMIKLNKDFSNIFMLFYQQKANKESKKQNPTIKKSMKSILKKLNNTTFQQKKIIKIQFFKKQLYGKISNIDNMFSLFGSMIVSFNWSDYIKGIKIYDQKQQVINFNKLLTFSLLIKQQDKQLQCIFWTQIHPQNFL